MLILVLKIIAAFILFTVRGCEAYYYSRNKLLRRVALDHI